MQYKILPPLFLALCAVALSANGPSQAVTATIQQRFDAAAARFEKGDAGGALADFVAIETDLASLKKPNRTSLALVRIGKAKALFALDRAAEAKLELRQALEGGGLDAQGMEIQRDNANLLLASLLELELDYVEAAKLYADRKSTRLNSSHIQKSRMPSSA